MSALTVVRRIRCAAMFLVFVVLLPMESRAVVCTTSVRVAATAVAFGTYNPQSSTPKTANGTVTVSCQQPNRTLPPFVVSVSTGNSGGYAPRKMAFGAVLLSYNLFTSGAYTTIWGDGTGGTVTVSGGGGAADSIDYTVYGQIPIAQSVAAGSYTDAITVTVTY